MKSSTGGVPEVSNLLRDQRRVKAVVLGYEAILLLLRGAFVLIGNGVILVALPLLLILFWRKSARQLFERRLFAMWAKYAVVASLLVGVGIYILAVAGFREQNLIYVVWWLLV